MANKITSSHLLFYTVSVIFALKVYLLFYPSKSLSLWCALYHLLSLCLLCLSASLSDSSLWPCLLSADPLSAVRRGWRLSADWLVRRLSAAEALDWRLSADRLTGSLSAAEALMMSTDLLVRSLSAEALDCRLSANKLGCLSTSRLADELVFSWFLYLADRSPPVVRDVLNKATSQNK